ncbi:hypothetical protein N9L68_03015 [bacterium]|nr:hypothetical protein [bacterium]
MVEESDVDVPSQLLHALRERQVIWPGILSEHHVHNPIGRQRRIALADDDDDGDDDGKCKTSHGVIPIGYDNIILIEDDDDAVVVDDVDDSGDALDVVIP